MCGGDTLGGLLAYGQLLLGGDADGDGPGKGSEIGALAQSAGILPKS